MNDLLCWLQACVDDDDESDTQMKEDAKAGNLNILVQRAKTDIAANRVKFLGEILNENILN